MRGTSTLERWVFLAILPCSAEDGSESVGTKEEDVLVYMLREDINGVGGIGSPPKYPRLSIHLMV